MMNTDTICQCGSSIIQIGVPPFVKRICEECGYGPMFCMCVGGQGDLRRVAKLVGNETEQTLCIETYPASDGFDRCTYIGVHSGLHVDEYGRSWSTETATTISQDQPQPHDESISVTSNVRELVRDNTIASRAHYEATRDLFESLENIIKDQETEIRRLRDEQIGALATFLLGCGTIPKPEEGACATAIRVISELTGDGA